MVYGAWYSSSLPTDLLRVVLEFSGSLLNERHRKHRFLQLELGIYKLMNPRGITPVRLRAFYSYHGRDVLLGLIRLALRKVGTHLEVTGRMANNIC